MSKLEQQLLDGRVIQYYTEPRTILLFCENNEGDKVVLNVNYNIMENPTKFEEGQMIKMVWQSMKKKITWWNPFGLGLVKQTNSVSRSKNVRQIFSWNSLLTDFSEVPRCM